MSKQIENSEDTIDLKELFFSILSHWKLILLCIFLSLVCALLYLRVTPNTYSVDALVQVEDNKGASAALLGDLSNVIEQKSPAQSEIEILKSRLILGQTIRKLNLDILVDQPNNSFSDRLFNSSDFKANYSPASLQINNHQDKFTITKFQVSQPYLDQDFTIHLNKNELHLVNTDTGESFKGKLSQENIWTGSYGLVQLKVESPNGFKTEYTIKKLSLRNAVQMLSSKYSVSEKGKLTGILGLSYQGTDKAHITEVLNEILKTYIKQNIERRSAETQQTLSFLDEQLPELKQELDQAERAFNRFREQNNTVDVAKESELLLTQSIALETTKLELQQKQAELSAKYTSEHPLMREVNAQLQEIQERQNGLNNDLKRLPEIQRQYLQLFRDVEVNTQLYTTLLNNYQQLRIAKAGEIGNIRVIDYAVEPIQPIKPKKLQILVLSVFLGGFFGVLISLAMNMMRTGIRDSIEIETNFGLPVYGTVPRSMYQPSKPDKLKQIPILSINHSDDLTVESLRSVRTTILFALANAKHNVIAISSASPEAGKSFISTNLSVLLAQNSKKVLLIDADLRRGYLYKYFHSENQSGLSQVLLGQKQIDDAIIPSDHSNLYFLPRGSHPNNPSELLNSQQFEALIQNLRQQFDYIVIDTPPVLAVTDSLIIARHTGVNVLIANYAQTHIKEMGLAINRFENVDIKVNGIILNNVDIQSNSYGNGYNYAYAYTKSKD